MVYTYICSPSISVAQYSQENDASDKAIQVNLHCQSVDIPAEQAMVESLTIAKHIFKTVGVSLFWT